GVIFLLKTSSSRIAPAAVFAGSGVGILGTSTLYSRITWGAAARSWTRRGAHAAIYLLIAGTYTPVGLISLHGAWRWSVLLPVWIGAAAAALSEPLWVRDAEGLSAH